MKKLFISAIILSIILCVQTSYAGQPASASNAEKTAVEKLQTVLKTGALPAYRKELIDLLKAKNYTALDSYLSALQKAYEKGEIDSLVLTEGYMPLFTLGSSSYAPFYAGWIGMMPTSYPARLTNARFLANRAADSRGEAWAEKTSKAQFAAFGILLQKAMDEDKKSLKLTAKPILSLSLKLGLLRSASSLGLSEDAKMKLANDTLAQATAIDPANFWPRYNYMVILQPRWGGSYEQMKSFVEDTKQKNAPKPVVDFLESMIFADQASYYFLEKNYGKALKLYKEAYTRQSGFYDYAIGQEDLHNYIAIAKLYAHQNNTEPGVAKLYGHLGPMESQDPDYNPKSLDADYSQALDILLKDGRYVDIKAQYYTVRAILQGLRLAYPESWKDYKKAADGGDAEALGVASVAYCKGWPLNYNVKPDQALCNQYTAAAIASGGYCKDWPPVLNAKPQPRLCMEAAMAAQSLPSVVTPEVRGK